MSHCEVTKNFERKSAFFRTACLTRCHFFLQGRSSDGEPLRILGASSGFCSGNIQIFELRAENSPLRVKDFTLRVEDFALRVEDFALRVEALHLRGEGCVVRTELFA